MKHIAGAREKISEAVMSWEGNSSRPHRFGGLEFRFGKRELGHLHGDCLLDIPTSSEVPDELENVQRVQPHHIHPESGSVSFYFRRESDVDEAFELLRPSSEIAKDGVGAEIIQTLTFHHQNGLDIIQACAYTLVSFDRTKV